MPVVLGFSLRIVCWIILFGYAFDEIDPRWYYGGEEGDGEHEPDDEDNSERGRESGSRRRSADWREVSEVQKTVEENRVPAAWMKTPVEPDPAS